MISALIDSGEAYVATLQEEYVKERRLEGSAMISPCHAAVGPT
jgi:hypothetical protein